MMWRWIIRGILFVVLVVLAVRHYRRKPSVGLPVKIVTNECSNVQETLYTRGLRLKISGDGKMLINTEPVSAGSLGPLLADIYKTRNRRLLYVEADDLASYEDMVTALDVAEGAVPEIEVLIVTPSVRKECDEGFDIKTPGAGVTSYTVNSP